MSRKAKRTDVLGPGEIIPLNFDEQFNRIMNNEDNIIILENFLSIFFEKPLSEYKGKVKLNQRNLPSTNKKEHDKQVDLIVDIDGEKTNIELNNNKSEGITNRNVVMAAHIHGKQLKYRDKKYTKIKNTVQININNFSCNEDEEVETYYLRNKKGKILTEKFRIYVIDVVKLSQKDYNGSREKLAKFCRALNATTLEEFKKEIDGTMEKEAEKKLIDDVDKYSRDDEVIALYSAYSKQELERNTILEEETEKAREKGHKEGFEQGKEEGFEQGKEEGFEQGIEQGIEQGREKGINEKSLEIAKKLTNMDMPIEDISKVTGLSLEKILKLND